MTATTAPANHLSVVKAIGSALRRTEEAVPAILATAPEGFDPSARGAVAELVHTWACGDAERPAVKVGPKGNQRATDYGRGVDALVKAVKAAMASDDPKPVTLRATLSGEGGGSATIPADHPLYAAIVALITADES